MLRVSVVRSALRWGGLTPICIYVKTSSLRSFRTAAPLRFDFNALSEKLGTVDARIELDALRRTHSDLATQAASVGEIKPIDWAFYAKNIKTPGIVDSFKKSYESLTPKKLDNPFLAELDQNFAALMKDAEEAKAFSEKEIIELEAKLTELRTTGDVTKITVKEEAAKNPQLMAEIESEINNHEWFK